MGDEYKQGDEFKVGKLSNGAKRVKLEGLRQGRDAYGGEADDRRSPAMRRADQQFHDMMQMIDQAQIAQLQSRFDQAEEATARALEQARKRELGAKEAFEKIREQAHRLDDGTLVFLSADRSTAYDEHGNELSDQQFDSIAWRDDAPTWEDWTERKRGYDEAQVEREEIQDYQDRLRDGRQKLDGGELSSDEFNELQDLLQDMPQTVRAHMGEARPDVNAHMHHDLRASAAKHYDGPGIQTAPLNPAFSGAAAPAGKPVNAPETGTEPAPNNQRLLDTAAPS